MSNARNTQEVFSFLIANSAKTQSELVAEFALKLFPEESRRMKQVAQADLQIAFCGGALPIWKMELVSELFGMTFEQVLTFEGDCNV